ncbi:hypothetical protein JMJ77_0003171 [Colletotrichum scovillei]|uniref:Uncharacterized protein n=1 Tax=Colletotrichum scovillei TaxID=1209932 RepID=A0A9P7UCW4_9PEZI|nr:hypothetical protein JMJ78_0006384 [Colletotrichum scovillei]KAG7043467.1 hypothetical protein JMJ77_0003171 [Colletotrichum scovillei]KAG7062917.1 hypothetical protein JMJ76_0009758 [Colletotrichum scovillei]
MAIITSAHRKQLGPSGDIDKKNTEVTSPVHESLENSFDQESLFSSIIQTCISDVVDKWAIGDLYTDGLTKCQVAK